MLSLLGRSEQNKGPEIKAAIALLQEALSRADIPLRLLTGADVHVVPDLLSGLNLPVARTPSPRHAAAI
jgi:hypothetical protein